MAKKKSKKKKAKPQETQSNLGFVGTSVQQIATTIAGLVATQLVETIVDRLAQKFPILGEKPEKSDRMPETIPIQEGNLTEPPKEVVSVGAIDALKSTVADAAPAVGTVVDLLKNGAQEMLQKSGVVFEPVMDTVTNVTSGTMEQTDTEPKKKKKKGKKKKKKD